MVAVAPSKAGSNRLRAYELQVARGIPLSGAYDVPVVKGHWLTTGGLFIVRNLLYYAFSSEDDIYSDRPPARQSYNVVRACVLEREIPFGAGLFIRSLS